MSTGNRWGQSMTCWIFTPTICVIIQHMRSMDHAWTLASLFHATTTILPLQQERRLDCEKVPSLSQPASEWTSSQMHDLVLMVSPSQLMSVHHDLKNHQGTRWNRTEVVSRQAEWWLHLVHYLHRNKRNSSNTTSCEVSGNTFRPHWTS